MMSAVLGNSLPVFIGMTVILFGGAAFMTGQALAGTWRPLWHAVPYALLLAAGDRFLSFALFEGELLSLPGFVIDAIVLFGLALLAYRLRRAHLMVQQYPWLYERSGLFTWSEKQRG
jgi:branched-chain amino acid transport system ATP-binding protein